MHITFTTHGYLINQAGVFHKLCPLLNLLETALEGFHLVWQASTNNQWGVEGSKSQCGHSNKNINKFSSEVKVFFEAPCQLRSIFR